MGQVVPTLPQILYQNLVHSGIISLFPVEHYIGYPIQNLLDWKTYSWFRSDSINDNFEIDISGSNMAANCFGFLSHNLGTCGVQVSLYRDGLGLIPGTTHTISDDGPKVWFFDLETNISALELHINKTGAYFNTWPGIGICFVGQSMELPVCPSDGFNPDPVRHNVDYKITRTGNLIGADCFVDQVEFRGEFEWLPVSWIENTLKPFFFNHLPKPFIFVPDCYNDDSNIALVNLSPMKLDSNWNLIFRRWAFNFIGTNCPPVSGGAI